MRIGIDARLFNKTGVGRYLKNLTYELSILDKKNKYFLYLNKKDFSQFESYNSNWNKRLLDIKWHSFEEQLFVPKILAKDRLDIIHFPYFNIPVFYKGPYLLTIHDLIVDHFDTGRASTLPFLLYRIKRLGYKSVMHFGIRRASKITAISQTTKKEIIDHYKYPKKNITVTFDALDENFRKHSISYKPKKLFKKDYILYVGNAYPHKNLERLINVFGKIRNRYKYWLVFAGDDDYFYPRLKEYARSKGLISSVKFFGNANDKRLIDLYTFAKCLVFPSLMEGFGLPTFEALQCGTMPVISDIEVFREIWKKDLPMFDPLNEKDLYRKLQLVLSLKKEKYARIVKKASQKINKFSWKKSAVKTLNIYSEILKDQK